MRMVCLSTVFRDRLNLGRLGVRSRPESTFQSQIENVIKYYTH